MITYHDWQGRDYVMKPGDARRPREGVFAIVIVDGRILLSWPTSHPTHAELPGGGIERGEDHQQALLRELYEETGLTLPRIEQDTVHEQMIPYYAQQQREFWDYTQHYYVLRGEAYKDYVFDGKRPMPEDGLTSWERLENLSSANMQNAHLGVLMKLGLLKV